MPRVFCARQIAVSTALPKSCIVFTDQPQTSKSVGRLARSPGRGDLGQGFLFLRDYLSPIAYRASFGPLYL